MSEFKPDWYERLKTGPFRGRTFTDEHMRSVVKRAEGERQSAGSGAAVRRIGLGGMTAAIVAAIVLLQQAHWFGTEPAAPAPTSPPIVSSPPTESPQPVPKAYYVKGRVGVYSAPEYGGMPPLFVAEPGVAYETTDSANGFVRIRSEGLDGWVNEWYLTSDPEERSVATVSPYVMLVGSPAQYRSNPDERNPSGFELAVGKVVRVVKEYEDWLCIDIVTYDQPYEGDKWVKRSELVPWDPAAAREGHLKPGGIVRDWNGEETELPAGNPIFVEEQLDEGMYRIGSAGGFTGFIGREDFVPNPFLPPSAFDWLLPSADLEEKYRLFAESGDEELLRGLTPLDVFRFYVKASEAGDYETQYALYIRDPEYDVPDYESFMNDISHDPDVLNRSRQQWLRLKQSFTPAEETDGDQALIRMSGPKAEDVRGFRLIRSRDGIWKAAWLPMQ